MQTNNHRKKLSHTLALMTLLALIAQLSFFIIYNINNDIFPALAHKNVTSQAFHSPHVLIAIGGQIIIQLALYLLYTGLVWCISDACARLLALSAKTRYRLGVTLWLNGTLLILALNLYYFPTAYFSQLIITGIPVTLSHLNTLCMLVIAITAFSVGILLLSTLIYYLFYSAYRLHYRIVALIGIISAAWLNQYIINPPPSSYRTTQKRPNIIMLGIDAVRTDRVHALGNQHMQTPALDQIITHSTYFSEAYTTVARTFTSWITILTGENPIHSGARFNLTNVNSVDHQHTLAHQLKKQGYETIYATDDKHFSNITKAYGFDHIVGPKMGAPEFICATFLDFPLSNLLINTPLGRFLFPYNYGNRIAYTTYHPQSFNALLKTALAKRTNKPLFIAIHLTLSHWPYTWAGHDQIPVNKVPYPLLYVKSIEREDKQVQTILTLLQKNKLLNHAILVLLSDHGSGQGLVHDRTLDNHGYHGNQEQNHVQRYAYSFNLGRYGYDTSVGHGTDVLSKQQYNAILAFDLIHLQKTPPKIIKTPVSFTDIAPTIMQLINLHDSFSTDGISLAPSILQGIRPPSHRNFFFETGLVIPAIIKNNLNTGAIVSNASIFYALNKKNGLLFIKAKAYPMLLHFKQFSVMKDQWILALYPEREHTKIKVEKRVGPLNHTTLKKPRVSIKKEIIKPYYVLANTQTHEWTTNMCNAFAQSAPTHQLYQQLSKHFGQDLYQAMDRC
jgi:hypothetical protein